MQLRSYKIVWYKTEYAGIDTRTCSVFLCAAAVQAIGRDMFAFGVAVSEWYNVILLCIVTQFCKGTQRDLEGCS